MPKITNEHSMIAEKFAIVNEVKIRYLISDSSAPKLLFLHGMSFNADTWQKTETLQYLEQHGVDTIAIDFPGFGKSEKHHKIKYSGYIFSNDDNLKTGVEFINAFIESLDLKNINLLGASMGGELALNFAVKYPSTIEHLILVAPVGVRKIDLKDLESIIAKTMIILGTKDRIVKRKDMEYLEKALKNAKLSVYIDADHPVYLSFPEKFNKEIVEFLKK